MTSEKNTILVQAENYETQYQKGNDLIQMEHRIENHSSKATIDVFTELSSLTITSSHLDLIAVRKGNQVTKINSLRKNMSGPLALYIPPFSVIEWVLSPGTVEFVAIIKLGPIVDGLPKKPLVFDWEEKQFPSSKGEFDKIVSNINHSESIARFSQPCEVTRLLKQEIDQHYKTNLRIEKIAQKLGVNHAVMSRKFKKNIGLSPVAYRNRLRISDSKTDKSEAF